MLTESALDAASTLETLDLFKNVDPTDVLYLLEACSERSIEAGEVLLNPHLDNDAVYVIMKGALEVRNETADGRVITTLERGACVGEMSMIEGLNPNAYVVATERSHLLAIRHETLWALITSSHAMACNLLTLLLRRVQADKQMLRENAAVMRKYQRRSLTDALTDLYNRYGMKQFFPRAIDRCRRDNEPACLVVIDIDNFRDFNNTHGHQLGDEVLCAVADKLLYSFRPTDLKARYGGDEFTVLLPNTSLEHALATADRVCRAIRDNQPIGTDDGLKVSVSMGVAAMSESGDLDELFGRADAALYRAKKAGRDRVSQ
ncbi:MAG: GGDEF domain-containing protein [Pseudomonadota bacterium]